MSKFYNIKLNITICKLDNISNIAAAKKSEVLGNVSSVNIKYAINSIPKATISLPVGSKLTGDGAEESYVYTQKINKLADESIPVGIFIQALTDELPPGIPRSEFCIFKGFIEGCTFTRDAGYAVVTLQLAHWLQALTIFPMVNTMIAPHSAGSIGRGFMISGSEEFRNNKLSLVKNERAKNKTAFTFVQTAYNTLLQYDPSANLWLALQQLIADTMPSSKDVTSKFDPGYASKHLLDRALGALEAIKDKHLQIISFGDDKTSAIDLGIASYIANLSVDQLSTSTPWDKLISEFLPSFYMAITPLVDSAYIIPAPGSFISESSCYTLTQDDYHAIKFVRGSRPVIGGVALTFENNQNIEISFRYPQDPQPGPFVLIGAPAWMPSSEVIHYASHRNSDKDVYFHFKTEMGVLDEAGDTEDRLIEDCVIAIEKVLRSIVRSTYQTICFQGRVCTMTTPFRADITPGTQLKIIPPDTISKSIKEDGEDSFVCGTVTGVTFNINQNLAQTIYEINNLRTQTEMSNEKLTAKEGVFFKDAWTYNDGKLYVQEKTE